MRWTLPWIPRAFRPSESEGGHITFACPDTFTVKGGAHGFVGPAAVKASYQPMPEGTVTLGAFQDATPDTSSAMASATAASTSGDDTTADDQPVEEPQKKPAVFHIVTQRTTLAKLLPELYETPPAGIVPFTKQLNPALGEDLHPGQLLILSHPYGEQDEEQIAGMQAAQQEVETARQDLDDPTQQAAIDYFDLFDHLSGSGAAGIGLFASATGKKLDAVQKILREIENLHQDTFNKHGTIKTPEFYAQRRALFARLDTALGQLTLKYTGFEDSAKVKSQLGISTKSIMHNWKQAGTSAGGIPGYAENYTRIAKYSKWMRGVGNVAIALEGANFGAKLYEACTVGREDECEQTAYVDGGEFAGSTLGGVVGAGAAYGACNLAFGFFSAGTSLLWCGIVAGGAGGLAGGSSGGVAGKALGTQLYKKTGSNNGG